MRTFDSSIHWRPWSVAIVLAIFIAVFSLTQFNLLQWSFALKMGCLVSLASAGWNAYVILLVRKGKGTDMNGEIADGLLITGLLLVFVGAFF